MDSLVRSVFLSSLFPLSEDFLFSCAPCQFSSPLNKIQSVSIRFLDLPPSSRNVSPSGRTLSPSGRTFPLSGRILLPSRSYSFAFSVVFFRFRVAFFRLRFLLIIENKSYMGEEPPSTRGFPKLPYSDSSVFNILPA